VGTPVVPLEYGSTTTSFAGSIATAGGSASTAIDASVGVLSHASPILILDEPTAGLDAGSEQSVKPSRD
jgi:alpha-D-ribose 1-methylphosphonate 5-triphosphate synthase subunit PhnL